MGWLDRAIHASVIAVFAEARRTSISYHQPGPAQLAKNIGITGILASAVAQTQDQSAWTQAALIQGLCVVPLLTVIFSL